MTSPRGDAAKVFLGSALWLGLSPVAPGSFGALAGVGADVAVTFLLPATLHRPLLLAILLGVCLLHYALTPWAVRHWREADPKHFVLDEVAGYLLVALLFRGAPHPTRIVSGFLLFRVLDIVKVPPARQVDQRMHGAWGILLDDLISAGYAAALLALWWRYFPALGLPPGR